MSLLGEVNQHILACPSQAAPQYPKRGASMPLPWAPSLDSCRWALTALAHMDAVVELATTAVAGEQIRLNAITLIELLRAVLKLLVLVQSGERHLILGGQAHLDTRCTAAAASRSKAAMAASAPPATAAATAAENCEQ